MADPGKVIAIGDFNARVTVPHLRVRDGNYYQYQGVQDNVVNEHGRRLAVANHLYRNDNLLRGDLSFRRRSTGYLRLTCKE